MGELTFTDPVTNVLGGLKIVGSHTGGDGTFAQFSSGRIDADGSAVVAVNKNPAWEL